MYRYEDIRSVHLEPSSRCNARCPQCSRNQQGGKVNPLLPLSGLSLDDVLHIFESDFVRQLHRIHMCGDYGDPTSCRDLLNICRYFRFENPKISISVHTNGGVRPAEWWKELAVLINECSFGIDGLEDTNHIYRRGVRWGAVMSNAKEFIAAGGNATWNYLVFQHNEHQVNDAAILAKEMGFRKFFAKKTSRFLRGNSMATSAPIRNNNGDIVEYLRPASESQFVNIETLNIVKSYPERKNYTRYLKDTEIECKAVNKQSVFINAQGFVIPCCWLGFIYSPKGRKGIDQFKALVDTCDTGFAGLNAKSRSLKEIINGSLFQSAMPASWKPGSPDRIMTCATHCGMHKISQGQWDKSVI